MQFSEAPHTVIILPSKYIFHIKIMYLVKVKVAIIYINLNSFWNKMALPHLDLLWPWWLRVFSSFSFKYVRGVINKYNIISEVSCPEVVPISQHQGNSSLHYFPSNHIVFANSYTYIRESLTRPLLIFSADLSEYCGRHMLSSIHATIILAFHCDMWTVLHFSASLAFSWSSNASSVWRLCLDPEEEVEMFVSVFIFRGQMHMWGFSCPETKI